VDLLLRASPLTRPGDYTLARRARLEELSARLEAEGFLVVAIRPPTVPPGTARLRVAFSAAHSESQVDALADAIARLHAG